MALITALSAVDARLEEVPWDFADASRAMIDAHWQSLVANKPRMFNGEVLMQHRWSIEDGVYRCAYTPVRYASFVAWIQHGQPGAPRRNGFAMGALRSADGAFLLGCMADHTLNAGKIYFPGGTPDRGDITADGRVDLAGSLVRELIEETGLRDGEFTVLPEWSVVVESYRAAFLKPVTIDLSADDARRLLLARIAAETDGELADIVVVRSSADINRERTPLFAAAYMDSVFASQR